MGWRRNKYLSLSLGFLLLLTGSAPLYAQMDTAVATEAAPSAADIDGEAVVAPEAPSEFQQEFERQPLEGSGIDRERWEKERAGMDFKPEKEEKEEPVKTRSKSRSWKWDFGLGKNITQVIVYTIAIGALLFLLWYLLRNGLGISNRRVKPVRVLDAEDVDLDNVQFSDIELMLRQALSAGDYRTAIRARFLMILKQLSDKELIRWQKRKTNTEYLLEMNGHSTFQELAGVTRWYEMIWYGNARITQQDFERLDPIYRTLISNYSAA